MLAVVTALTAAALAADPLVDLGQVIADVVLEMRYAGAANFLGRAVYPRSAAFLRRSSAAKLAQAAAALREKGLRLTVFDAYRPLSVQRLMWKAKPDPRFVADPMRGSAHNRGGAVDVGLRDAAGRALSMPSAFDEFGPRAAHDAPGASREERTNARILKAAMETAGFASLAEEWWHYRDPASKDWPLLDIPLEELAR
ncbi:MAG: M15 family metallopeptidase [Elusimicrobiota bacterium]